MTPSDVLRRWIAREELPRAEVATLFGRIMDGELEDAMTAALLAALATKGETVGELAGAASAMRARALPVPHARPEAIDTCGTGGDGKGTFNVSTAAALVAAAGGAAVAKHGNRAVSSRSGSSDVLAALGIDVDVAPERAARQLDEHGIAFLFAPRHHPAVAAVMPVRRALGVRTVFNLLGPLTNPAGAKRQLLGVFAADRVEPMARVLAELGSERAWVVHGSDGLDELTTTGPSRVASLRDGEVRLFEVEPEGLGVRRGRPEELAGGTPEENAVALERLLDGEPGPLAEIVALNAGVALHLAGLEATPRAGVGRAREVLASGAARAKLEALRGGG